LEKRAPSWCSKTGNLGGDDDKGLHRKVARREGGQKRTLNFNSNESKQCKGQKIWWKNDL